MRVGDYDMPFFSRSALDQLPEETRLAVAHMGEREYLRLLADGHTPMVCAEHGWVGESRLPCPVPRCPNGCYFELVLLEDVRPGYFALWLDGVLSPRANTYGTSEWQRTVGWAAVSRRYPLDTVYNWFWVRVR